VFEIGSSLREARMRQGLDFPELEAATKIRGKYLRALEDEDFTQLPAETYVKGFLRTYAEHLGLDGQLYVDEFNSRYGVGEEAEQPARRTRTSRPRQRRRLEAKVLILSLAGIALVTALVIVAWTSGSPSKQHVTGLTPAPTTHGTQTKPARPHGPASISLVAKRDVLLTVRKSRPTGKILFNATLPAGRSKHFTTKRLWMQVGTPENLRITVNRARVTLPTGGPGVFYVTARGVTAS
jgi:cytoskeleton protein RodZ